MEKKITIFAITFAILAFTQPGYAQQAGKVPQIGYLDAMPLSMQVARREAFLKGLRELGYVEGKNIIIQWRSAEGKRGRLLALAAELVRLNVDVILSVGASTTRAAKKATSKIPIVIAQHSDPVGSGFVASLARPGGNVTGLSTLAPEVSAKQMQLLKEIIPKLSRVAVLGTSTRPGNAQALREIKRAAEALRVKLQYVDVLDPKGIEPAFAAAKKARVDAVLVLAGRILIGRRRQVVKLALKSRLPAMYPFPVYVEAGGLMSYGVRRSDLFRRAATYVDKILKGAKPADLPVERPTKFSLVVNLKTAKALGISFPPSILLQADKVIE
ncbi:MAG: ABC transporter substrate-binding protein [Alphaproteobacteria bacterium]|nr:ABC transporter substrate-binding protein [Alphaproteobacteria bacterium]